MTVVEATAFLRRVLLWDAAVCGAAGLVLVPAAGGLEERTGLPAPLLRVVGLVVIPWAGLLAAMARMAVLPRAGVAAVMVGNAGWALASVLALAFGALRPTPLGDVFVLAQAAVVAWFAERQAAGLRRAG